MNEAFIRFSRGTSEAGDEAFAAEGLFDEVDGSGDADESGTLGLPSSRASATTSGVTASRSSVRALR